MQIDVAVSFRRGGHPVVVPERPAVSSAGAASSIPTGPAGALLAAPVLAAPAAFRGCPRRPWYSVPTDNERHRAPHTGLVSGYRETHVADGAPTINPHMFRAYDIRGFAEPYGTD